MVTADSLSETVGGGGSGSDSFHLHHCVGAVRRRLRRLPSGRFSVSAWCPVGGGPVDAQYVGRTPA